MILDSLKIAFCMWNWFFVTLGVRLPNKVTHTIKEQLIQKRAALNCVALAGGILIAAIIIQLSPALQTAFQFDRVAIESGQLWRIITCHFVHWGWPHLAGDISGVLGLIWLVWHKIQDKKFALTAMGIFFIVSLSVLFQADDINLYRGMSGVNHAILGWLLISKIFGSSSRVKWLLTGTLLILIAKVICEFHGFFTVGTGLPDGIKTVAVAHAAGLLCGMAIYFPGRKNTAIAYQWKQRYLSRGPALRGIR